MTRRALLGHLAALAAFAQSDDDPLRQLRGAHPRLIFTDSDLERMRALVRDHPVARRAYLELEKECDRLLPIAPADYKIVGGRLRVVAHRVNDRVAALGLMYRLTQKDAYQRRALAELRAAANFRDWNPGTFIDTAEMTHAVALGYDWLYNSLSPTERQWMRDAIFAKGLDPALAVYQKENGWPKDRFHWNVVCNACIGFGALAVAELSIPGEPILDYGERERHDKSSQLLRFALESIPHGLASYGLEGAWPEGPDYWNFATRYACIFFSALHTSLGNDYGLSTFHGVDRAGRFRLHTTGPGGKSFNYGDSVEDAGLAPEMFWLAKRFSAPANAWSEQRAMERATRPDAYDLAWFDRDARPPQAPPAGVLDRVFRGVNVACFRSVWDDPAAIFFAVKGGDNKAPHAHLDLGTFVLDAGGVRWASDPGPEDYDLPGYFGKQRYSYYKVRTEAHNTLLIDNEIQDAKAEAHITRQESTPDLSWVQIDLSKASPGKVKQWIRRAGMAQRQAVLIGDSVRSDQPVEVIWGMMTDADITLSGQTATLRKNGWNLAAEIRSPRHAVFDVAALPATATVAAGTRRLIVRLGDKVTELDLNIVLTPYKDGQSRPKITVPFPV